jgi:hypothetical protein
MESLDPTERKAQRLYRRLGIVGATAQETKEPPTMATNRIKRIEAKWLPFLLAHNLATVQEIADARRRQAADLAARLRKKRGGE